MKINIKIMTTLILLLLFYSLNGADKNYIYAKELEDKLDLLIENKNEQISLEEEISTLEEEINYKSKIVDNIEDSSKKDNSEVVTVSFIGSDNSSNRQNISLKIYLKDEIIMLKNYRQIMKEKLEAYIIEEAKIEKLIIEEKKNYLKENNLKYISGIWPLESYKTISSPFGNRIHPISGEYKFHKGVDIPAPDNTNIMSSDDGIVIFSGSQSGYGNIVKIKHFDDKITVYAHNTSNLVKEGDVVKKGQVIAKVGSTGNSTGSHVHFEVIINEENINPLDSVNI